MKRFLVLIFCLALCMSCCAVRGESEISLDDFFRTLDGHISYTLPCAPIVEWTDDVTEEQARSSGVQYTGWLNKTYLWCTTEDMEMVIILADLSPMINQMMQDYPGKSEATYQDNALMNLAYLEFSSNGAEFDGQPQASVVSIQGRSYGQLEFYYHYRDEAEICRGKGLMEGTRAVLFMTYSTLEGRRLMDEMYPVSEAEAAQLRERSPETLSFASVQVTFPGLMDRYESDGYYQFDAYGPDYSYLILDIIPMKRSEYSGYLLSSGSVSALLDDVGLAYTERGDIEEYTVAEYAPGKWRCEGKAAYPQGIDPGYTYRQLLYVYVLPDGIYTFTFPDNEVGHAFMDSARFLTKTDPDIRK